ncbi:MAG: glycyl-radical enzyme activating protein [Clostridia bacterium]|nr:glycyl-radical enzyme activating protein [Clostridia bacterium]
MTGIVFNIQRFSLFDGPGVRTVVFLKGCPLRCVWCHNPEGLSSEMQVMYNSERCIGCGACVEACEKGCHTMKDGFHVLDRKNCISCGECAKVCFSLSLTSQGVQMTVNEVMDTVMRDLNVYRDSGGGLTLSGGEPLMQAEFSSALLKAAKDAGLHTCTETSGFGSSEALSEMAAYTDIFLFDYKLTGDEAHTEYCGAPGTPILHNLGLLDSLGKKVILRCPLIPDINTTKEHMEGIARVALSHPYSVSEIQIEPYHRLGISKAVQLGITPTYEAEVPDKDFVREFADGLRELCKGKVTVKINQ